MNDHAANVPANTPSLSVKRLLVPLLARPSVAQGLKYSVYLALLINSVFYFQDDYLAVRAALPSDAPLLEVLTMYATSIDTIAWIGLVFLFELETYALPDEAFTNWLTRSIHAARVLCYVLIGFAAYGYTADAMDTYHYSDVAGIDHVCEFPPGTSLQTNIIDYVEITPDNCAVLTQDTRFYRLHGEVSVIAASTLPHLQRLGWIDICNAFVWIAVVLLIELEVRLHSADRFSSPVTATVRRAKTILYLILICNALIWVFAGYSLYTWDAFLWIFGFWAIELNLAEWEQERVGELENA